MKNLILALLIALPMSVQATDWIDYKHKTYLGGYYAAVCNACINGRYHNDTTNLWRCSDDREVTISPVYQKGCAKAVWDAFVAKRPTS